MRFFVNIKSWQLFTLMWGLPGLLSLVFLDMLQAPLYIFLTLLCCGPFFSWLYALRKALNAILPESTKIPGALFVFHFWYCIGFIVIGSILTITRALIASMLPVFVIASSYYAIALFIIIRSISKALASVELNKPVSTFDYIRYIMLLYFSPVGIWIIQPKIREILAQKSSAA